MLSVVATMEHRKTCQCRPKQGPAMKSRATVDSSAAESTYKVRGISLMVKQQISNLRSRVRFSYPAPLTVKNSECSAVW